MIRRPALGAAAAAAASGRPGRRWWVAVPGPGQASAAPGAFTRPRFLPAAAHCFGLPVCPDSPAVPGRAAPSPCPCVFSVPAKEKGCLPPRASRSRNRNRRGPGTGRGVVVVVSGGSRVDSSRWPPVSGLVLGTCAGNHFQLHAKSNDDDDGRPAGYAHSTRTWPARQLAGRGLVKSFQDSISYRILRFMHEALNIDENKS